MNHDDITQSDQTPPLEGSAPETYEHPEITDYGALAELTLGGTNTQTDGLGMPGS